MEYIKDLLGLCMYVYTHLGLQSLTYLPRTPNQL